MGGMEGIETSGPPAFWQAASSQKPPVFMALISKMKT
jgi:hypothetical protein